MPELPQLWRACLAGDVKQMTRMMDSNGLDPNQVDRNGENCMHMTSRSGEVEAMQELTARGVDINSSNHNGQTPLHIAVTKDCKDMVQFIVENRGDSDRKTRFSGMTALHMACKDDQVAIVRVLLDGGANCAIKDMIGEYPDFYTSTDKILSLFDTHFDVCTHGRGRRKMAREEMGMPVKGAVGIVPQNAGDDEHEHKKKKKKKKKEREKQEYLDLQHGDVEIYDKMEHYDHERAQENWDKVKRETKKVKINHGIDFSDEHKQRMQQNVFDRLIAGGKKKNQ